MSLYNVPQRPSRREDGWPTRSDTRYDTDAERMCRVLVGVVEQMGASVALTRAVTLLDQARNAIADHVERIEEESTPRRGPCSVDCTCLCHDVNGGPIHIGEHCCTGFELPKCRRHVELASS